MIEDSIAHSNGASRTSFGSVIKRGSTRGACTTARSLGRPNASLPCSETRKFRLLLTMLGNGCAGSRPIGVSTGSTSRSK